MSKKLYEMTDRELFLVATGDMGVILKAKLMEIIDLYLKHSAKSEELRLRDASLRSIVQEYYSGDYDADK